VSKHFALQPLAGGVYACIHKPGGGAYSNAGIVDLGSRTLVVDALQTLAAGRALRQAAEALAERSVETILLTHSHTDHWIGASAFDGGTALLASATTAQAWGERGPKVAEDFQNPAEWQTWLAQVEAQLQTEQDERVRAGLERSMAFIGYALAEMAGYEPRYADLIFEDRIALLGDRRCAQVRSLGRGHSADDAVLLLPDDGIAFIGDVGFFQMQPYLGDCDLDLYRRQLHFFQDSTFPVLVPGHGPVGGQEDVALQLMYMDVMEDLVGSAACRGASFEEALRVALPEPLDKWLMGGMDRFQVNVRHLFARAGGAVPAQE
jgi:glyoxylase-like metal-dependent hydrolase (beta-lactamase superfamily II)